MTDHPHLVRDRVYEKPDHPTIYVDCGAEKVIIGTSAFRADGLNHDFLRELPSFVHGFYARGSCGESWHRRAARAAQFARAREPRMVEVFHVGRGGQSS